MNIALNEIGKRIDPTPQGRGSCQICKEELIAHCGDIYSWHWQHKVDRNCDPWKEHETEWHRQWKNRFPKDWQEFVIENDEGERHIADVSTDSGLVLEFQNSSISTSTVRIREEFYDGMIWIVNAQEFRDNFKLRSVVSYHVRALDNELQFELKALDDEFKERVDQIKGDIAEQELKMKNLLLKIGGEQQRLDEFLEARKNIESITERIFQSWVNNAMADLQTINILNRCADYSFRDKIRAIQQEIKLLQQNLVSGESHLSSIYSLENIEVEGRLMKLIIFSQLPKSYYPKVLLIEKESRSTFFPVVKKINNDWEYNALAYQKDKYDIAIDLDDDIARTQGQIELLKNQIQTRENSIPTIKDELAKSLDAAIGKQIDELQSNISFWNEQSDEMIKKVSDSRVWKERVTNQKQSELISAKKEIRKEIQNKKYEYMSKKKGLYEFDWKRERPTWRVATEPLYFDIGENYLLERTGKYSVRKILLEVFLKKFR